MSTIHQRRLKAITAMDDARKAIVALGEGSEYRMLALLRFSLRDGIAILRSADVDNEPKGTT